jgi:hypothetical protein
LLDVTTRNKTSNQDTQRKYVLHQPPEAAEITMFEMKHLLSPSRRLTILASQLGQPLKANRVDQVIPPVTSESLSVCLASSQGNNNKLLAYAGPALKFDTGHHDPESKAAWKSWCHV